MLSGLVFNIQRYSLHDGPGIRTTVFLKGCPLSCWWCHNPEGQSPEPEIAFLEGRCVRCGSCREVCPGEREVEQAEGGAADSADRFNCTAGQASSGTLQANSGTPQASSGTPQARCIRCGACVNVCPSQARQMVGRRMTLPEVLSEILRDRIFFDDSGGGVTFSGGEPLLQAEFLCGLLKACRDQGIHTALDTCGYGPQEDLLAAAKAADLVLYDLKVMDDRRHQECTGVSNASILENLRALGRMHQNIWIRVPVIPGLNDDPESLEAIGRLAASVGGVRQVSLLPFHKTGLHKWTSLGQRRELPAVPPPGAESIARMAERLRAQGLVVQTGG